MLPRQNGDGYGDAETTNNITSGSDCNDEDSTIYTGADDAWYDGIDSMCPMTMTKMVMDMF